MVLPMLRLLTLVVSPIHILGVRLQLVTAGTPSPHHQMAQSLPQLFAVTTVATSTPQLILVRRGHSKQPLALATGTPSPHHQMAQNLPQLFVMATSTPQLILVRLGQQT